MKPPQEVPVMQTHAAVPSLPDHRSLAATFESPHVYLNVFGPPEELKQRKTYCFRYFFFLLHAPMVLMYNFSIDQ